ncbi:MAG TPA: response regulator [Spirochaetota bacterium]|nr:response regulator [Spirochaetota bacterium]HPU87593.1 response regulator [Spirochaetota bacterium]
MARVLLIYDNEAVAGFLKSILEAAAFDVTHVSTPFDAFREALQRAPDAILIDFYYKNVDGLYLIEKLRSTAGLTDVPFAVVSEERDFLLSLDALESGANDVIRYPINEDDFIDRMKKICPAQRTGGANEP